MDAEGYCLFDTALGVCSLAWRGEVVVGASLPDEAPELLRTRTARRHPTAVEREPPAAIAAVVEAVKTLLADGAIDLADIAVDLDQVEPFDRQVLEITRRIPPGRTRTYGQIAAELGQPRAAQAVGAALGRNPIPIIVPCHRVLAAGGKSGGFSAPGGRMTKLKLLAIENARVGDEPTLF
ncbi:MAG: cysteine methyltransferase [Caulobacterales bacterium 68-7]|nr:MAG: cysteine methyltransferase [Caulobacterales bacterium 68-7]